MLLLSSLAVPVVYAVVFVVLLAPGYLAARALRQRWDDDPATTLIVAYAILGLAGWLAFWCYFARPELGRALALCWTGLAIVAAALIARRSTRSELRTIALTFCVGLLYVGVLMIAGTAATAEHRFFAERPDDDRLPALFAERLYWGTDATKPLGVWQSSDRPPLQTGMLVLVRPLAGLVAHAVPVDVPVVMLLAGITAQLIWIPAMLMLCARLGFDGRRLALVLAFAIFSGFFLYNSVYVWPKLLAAGFGIGALIFATAPREPRTSMLWAGTCAALALLAHGSAVFFLVPAFALALIARRIAFAPAALGGVAIFAALLLPWAAYQHWVDPPGDALVKEHLAGLGEPHIAGGVVVRDPRSATRAIVDAYRQTPAATILANKAANVATALGAAPLLGSAVIGEPRDVVDRWRANEREHVIAALGGLNLGWLALAWWWFGSRREEARRATGALLALALAMAAFWCAALWGPGTTVTTHGPYALDLLLVVALGAAVAALPTTVARVVLACACADFAVIWVFGSLPDAWRYAPGSLPVAVTMLALMAAATWAIVALLRRLVREAS
ncbi:MAG TPA: hypothetical protein VGN14_17645 [Candidatus Elarobacter sp.]